MFYSDFTGGDGSTLIRAMDEAMGEQRQAAPKAATPCRAAADTTLGSTSQLHKEKTPQSAPTVSVDEDETQDPSGGMEG